MKTVTLPPHINLTAQKSSLNKYFFACGILSSILYIVMNIWAAMRYEGYDSISQTVSELSAIGAPTRSLWVPLGFIYTLLIIAFGWGIWRTSTGNRPLRNTGMMLFIYGMAGLFWPLAPMHQREVLAAGGGTFSDTMHIVFSMITVPLMMLAIGFSAVAFGRRFRVYAILTLGMLVVFGILTGIDGPKIADNLPTPFIGIWERILIGVFLAWAVVLGIKLLRDQTYLKRLNA